MAATASVQIPRNNQTVHLELLSHLPESVTLLELVFAISAISQDDQIVIDTVITMLARGRVRLKGNFRDCAIHELQN